MEKVKILCTFAKMVPIEKLVEHPRNPNRHPDKQLELLAKVIQAQGFRRPIVVSNRSGFVIVGHGRLQAARLAGMDAVPVDYQDYENEAEEWADMVADNKIASMADFDNEALANMFEELNDFDEELFGMVQHDIDKLMGRIERAEQENKAQEIKLDVFDEEKFEHVCPRCGFRF